MDEEGIRTAILVVLNSHYDGSATGETFNKGGKTDILIRSLGGNVFVAECKFWKGNKAFQETIDQLLSYVTWRDTKAAVVVFNRNKDFSNVLAEIPLAAESHPKHKRKLQFAGKCQVSRNIFAHPDDSNREITLTVLAFDVPRRQIALSNQPRA